MTKRPDILRLSLGAQAETHKAALTALVRDLAIYGRNNVPSLSEMVSRIAIAYRHDPDRTAAAIGIILLIAAEAQALDGEKMQGVCRLVAKPIDMSLD